MTAGHSTGFINTDEAARLMRIEPDALRARIRRGQKFPGLITTVGGQHRFRLADMDIEIGDQK